MCVCVCVCSVNAILDLNNTEKYNFLGISIVGQSNERGDGGIYIGSIMKGGAVAADGRIEPGDMLLQVRRIDALIVNGLVWYTVKFKQILSIEKLQQASMIKTTFPF